MKQKDIIIEGMDCSHCAKKAENELNAIDGVKSHVDLEENTATVTLSKELPDDILIKAVEKAGFKVKRIIEEL